MEKRKQMYTGIAKKLFATEKQTSIFRSCKDLFVGKTANNEILKTRLGF